uniref:C2H2-type domain-containing protein n=2 Tax=Clastoptera arizonana TaxID=38151 RepID=A0A1B6EE42_9HEMI
MNDPAVRLTLNEFKSQIGCMLKSITHLKSSERTEAFGFLQHCMNNLESEDATNKLTDVSTESKSIYEWNKDTLQYKDTNSSYSEDEVLTCPNCKKQFLNQEDVLDHLQKYSGSAVDCDNCGFTFNNCSAYEYHKKLGICKIKVKKSKYCSFCKKSFNNKLHYSRHLDGHKRNDCKECEDKFAHRKQLAVHMLNVHNVRLESKEFSCKLCSQSFVQRRTLVHHYTITHADVTHVCSVCCQLFPDLNQLEDHVKSHNLKEFVCDKCQQTFSRRQQYIIHIKAHDRFKCEVCNKSFASKIKAIEHKRLGHTIKGLEPNSSKDQSIINKDEKKFSCVSCKISFKKFSIYKRHLLTSAHLNDQTSDVNIYCEECGKSFTRRDRLIRHQKTVHDRSKKIFNCEFCSHKSISETNLKKHVLLHMQKRQFICEICGSLFHSKSALKEHNKCLHSDEMSYSCEKCGRMFKLISSLNKHMLSHSDERTKVCHCGHAYKFTQNLKRHQQNVHGKVLVKKRVQRFYQEDTSFSSQPKKKNKKNKEDQSEENHMQDPVLTLLNTQTTASHEAVLLMSDKQDSSQILQVSYHNINFAEKPHLVYTQSLDMSNLQVVETMLHIGEDSLKGNESVLNHPSTDRNLFDRPLSEGGFLHPPIEPSLVTSLGESLNESTETNSKQNLIANLPDYIPHNFPFLNV